MSDAMIWIGGAAIIAFTVGYCLRAAHREPDPEENVKARQLAYSTGQRAANDRIREIYGDRWDAAACEFTLHFVREDAELAEITDDTRFPWFEAGYKQRLENLNRRYEQRMARLDHLNVTFHAKLGTQGQRVERIRTLARELAPIVGADPEMAARAAVLAKADLQTEVVGEFPELQGAMGRNTRRSRANTRPSPRL